MSSWEGSLPNSMQSTYCGKVEGSLVSMTWLLRNLSQSLRNKEKQEMLWANIKAGFPAV